MTNFNDVQAGDTIRFVVEGKVSHKGDTYVTIKDGFSYDTTGSDIKSLAIVEKRTHLAYGEKISGKLAVKLPIGSVVTFHGGFGDGPGRTFVVVPNQQLQEITAHGKPIGITTTDPVESYWKLVSTPVPLDKLHLDW